MSCAVHYFGAPNSNQNESPIKEFLARSDLTILSSTLRDEELIFSNEIPESENCLIFYKIPQSTSDDISIGLLTLEGGRARALYNSLSLVYLPGGAATKYPSNVEAMLGNLHLSLSSTLGLPQTSKLRNAPSS